MQQDRLSRLANPKIKLLIICLAVFFSCKEKIRTDGAVVNIDVFGTFKEDVKVKVIIDNEVIFNQNIKERYGLDRRVKYNARIKKKVKITYLVDGRDTSFLYNIEKSNYFKLATSGTHKL